MFTIWVKSGSTPRPRRTHRLRPCSPWTECGLHANYMTPVTTNKVKVGMIPPQFCHICFKYRYRFLSIGSRRRAREWRNQMPKLAESR